MSMSSNRSDSVFKALADPTRRQILKMLAEQELSAGDIAARFEISGPSMSHHFSVLKSAELIEGRRDGQQIIYSINTTAVQDLLATLIGLFDQGAKQ